jgi:HopA1 effector protein family
MSDYIEQVKVSISETVFHSPTAYSYFGNEPPRLAPRVRRAMTPKTARNYLLYQLQSHLYNEFYIRGGTSQNVWNDPDCDADAVSFVEALSAANEGSGCNESGWEVLATAENHLRVRKGNLELWVRPEDYSATKDGFPQSESSVVLHLPKELRGMSPGYYMALSDQEDVPGDGETLVRLYWNLTASGAPVFMRGATRTLNDAGLFFRLKVLNDPRGYNRCDAAVVYFRKSQYSAIMDCLSHLYPQVASYLKPRTPVFTKPVAPGLGVAEDPGVNESFGQHRCRVLADGMIRAYEQGAKELGKRLEIVTECYMSSGICLNEPYLNPSSTDVYLPFRS